ncbi:unnamed protein product [Chrysoparadoxa australica]
MMRVKGRSQTEALHAADLREVYQVLNSLGEVPWEINTSVFEVAKKAWEEGLDIDDLPCQEDMPEPLLAEIEAECDDKGQASNRHKQLVLKVKQHNQNLHSLRCDLKLKIAVVEQFKNDKFYFPYNMDFRGRAYPIPPHLNHLGSDFCRGVLQFAEARPLGPRGLYWLKIHLANVYGKDKLSFDERATFTDSVMPLIAASAADPLGTSEGCRWWVEADKPFQCLAACQEVIKAVQSPDPSLYCSKMPVHQDGSCNGLQHYAALGRDANGGQQVNLTPGERPGDVYTGVCKLVIEKIDAAAKQPPPAGASQQEIDRHRYSKMLVGMVDRKVVKQTVMTSVYGVTFIGARKQIQARLVEKFGIDGSNFDQELEQKVYGCAFLVAKLTMEAIGDLFSEARQIMAWLGTTARIVAAQDQPMTWVTPLGLPVLQPYRRQGTFVVKTLLQEMTMMEDSEDTPVAVARQCSAFPPNFVHSLDSTHMMMCAADMSRSGLPFTAVHDSYWAHAGNVDAMNTKLREAFVKLYSEPILENLHHDLSMRFPAAEFPPVPERGSLDLRDVLRSPYFFN